MLPCIFFFCSLFGQPEPSVPDGAGGYVPFTNSRVMEDGSLRPYDPAIDGIMGPDGSVYFPVQQFPPAPQGTVTVGPPEPMPLEVPRHTPAYAPRTTYSPHHDAKRRDSSGGGCYDQNGTPVNPTPPECKT